MNFKAMTLSVFLILTTSALAKNIECTYDGRSNDGPHFSLNLLQKTSNGLYDLTFLIPARFGMAGEIPEFKQTLAQDMTCIFGELDAHVLVCEKIENNQILAKFQTEKLLSSVIADWNRQETTYETLKTTIFSNIKEIDSSFKTFRSYMEIANGFDLEDCEVK